MKNNLYSSIVKLFGNLVKKIFRLEIHGEENIPSEGNFLICSNHLSIGDVMLIAAVYKRPINFMAKKELFSIPIFGKIIKAAGAIPVDRAGNDVAAIKKMISFYKEGCNIAIYPQGHRNKGVHPKDTVIHHGVGLVAWRTKCNVLPIAFWAKDWIMKPFRKTKIFIGKPIEYEKLNIEQGNSENYKIATDVIWNEILNLLEEK